MPAGAECPGDMASPDNDMLIAALVVVGLLAVGLAVMLVRRTREVRSVREIGERFAAVAQTGDLAERLDPMPPRAAQASWPKAPTG